VNIIYITLLTILASGLGTMTGFGTSTIMVPILLLFLPLLQTLLLVGVIHWFGDIWKIILFKKGLRWKLIFIFGISGIATTYAGANIIFSVPEHRLSQILGAFLIAYVIFLFVKPTFKIPQTNITAISGGALSGFCAGLFGFGGAIRSTFLSAFDLPKAIYITTAGAIALVIDTTRIITYVLNGTLLERQFMWGFLLFIPASFLGAIAAKKIVNHIPQKKFRMIIVLFLFLVGLKFLFFPG
jgi:uncharacterized membrane protein YfcA